MRISIQRFSITNYRSCSQAAFAPCVDLSALIGKNASGKSSILNAILLLKSLFGDGRRHGPRERASAKSRVNVEFCWGKHTITLRGDVYYSTSERTRDEVFGWDARWNFRSLTQRDEWSRLPWMHDLDFLEETFFQPHNNRRIRIPMLNLDLPRGTPKTLLGFLRQLSDFLSGISYYSASQFTDPTRCPVSLEVEDDRVRRGVVRAGAEHSKFLHDLYVASSSEERVREYQEFLGIVGASGLHLVDAISFKKLELPQSRYEVGVGGKLIREKLKRLLIIPNFRVDGNRLSPNQLSEGTFKTVALLFYLVIDKGSLLLIEEPEVCVHHGLLKSIVELIKSYSTTKQIVISTHSDFVLDSLAPENVFLVRKERGTGTRVKPVSKAMSAQDFTALKTYLAESGNLGEFWRHGGLGHD